MNIEEKQKELKRLVEARLATIPSDAMLSVGSYGEFTRDQILQEVGNETEIGRKMVEIQAQYLQKLKEGILYGNASYNETNL
jgi:hypothetical protein